MSACVDIDFMNAEPVKTKIQFHPGYLHLGFQNVTLFDTYVDNVLQNVW